MKKELCVACKERPISNKKRQLCQLCYGRLATSARGKSIINPIHEFIARTQEKKQYHAEIEFVKNFFAHRNWIHQPAIFRVGLENYSPDFYDGERNVFIEVSGTRQAYHFNKSKYDLFRKLFPKVNFEIRKASGQLVNEDSRDKNWEQ